MKPNDLEQIEIDVLLEALARRYGYDFRQYARSSLKRRLWHAVSRLGLRHIADLVPALLHDRALFESFLRDMSITVTEMFRDPHFFQAVRQRIAPVLRTYPFVKVWHAGCATGEEVYSMAITLHEEGLSQRVQIYATDFNADSLAAAREGIYPLGRVKDYTRNYNKAGGKGSLAEYYHAKYGSVKVHDWLKENVTFAYHNLVTDGVFGEMNVIVCRNVLIYFERALQNRVVRLFFDSLCHRGFLCLGTKETLNFTDLRAQFDTISFKDRIFRRMAIPATFPLVGACVS